MTDPSGPEQTSPWARPRPPAPPDPATPEPSGPEFGASAPTPPGDTGRDAPQGPAVPGDRRPTPPQVSGVPLPAAQYPGYPPSGAPGGYPAAPPYGHPPGYPPPGSPGGWGPPATPPPVGSGIAVDHVGPAPGGDFALVYPAVRPTYSGVAVGSLVAGIAAVLVPAAVCCFGLAGARQGWGVAAAGAFAVLGALVGAAGIVLGLVALRQVRRAQGAVAGRGLAVAGLTCGAIGVALTVGGLALAVTVRV